MAFYFSGPPNVGINASFRAQVIHTLLSLKDLAKPRLDDIMDQAGWHRAYSGVFPPIPTSESGGTTSWVPRSYVFYSTGGKRFVFFCGVEDDASATWLADGYANPSFPNGNASMRNPRWFAGLGPWLDLTRQRNDTWPETHIAGHSGGGVFGYLLSNDIRSSRVGVTADTLTMFGAPKLGNRTYVGTLGVANHAHWMNFDDPVPVVPPPYTSFNRIILWYGTIAANRFMYFNAYFQSGFVLQGDGSVHEVDLPDGIVGDPFAALTTWLSETRSGVRTGHSISTYVERLEAAFGGQSGGGGDAIPYGPGDIPPAVPTLQNAVVVSGQVQRAQSSFQTGRPEEAAIPPQQAFSTSRTGRTWWILFGGVPVAVGPHRRGARQLARIGNAFLRSMQTRGCVLGDDFISQFQAYIATASDPTSAFRPTLQLLPQ